jgi:hypothetical protein
MKYNELFSTNEIIIKQIIHDANIEIDSSLIVLVNEYIEQVLQPEYDDLPVRNEEKNKDTDLIEHNCCLPFLCFCHHNSTVYVEENDYNDVLGDEMLDLLMFLHNITIPELIMVAEYHNLYYKNTILKNILQKNELVMQEQLCVINWIYDHIFIYVYKQQHFTPSV